MSIVYFVILLHFLMARAIHTRVESPPCLVQSTYNRPAGDSRACRRGRARARCRRRAGGPRCSAPPAPAPRTASGTTTCDANRPARGWRSRWPPECAWGRRHRCTTPPVYDALVPPRVDVSCIMGAWQRSASEAVERASMFGRLSMSWLLRQHRSFDS